MYLLKILLAALGLNAVIFGTWAYNYHFRSDRFFDSSILPHWLQAALTADPFSNALTILILLWINSEVVYMFLTKRRNQTEKQEAVTAAVKQTQAETQAKADAAAQAWYDTIKDQLPADAPPPPWSRNGADQNHPGS